MKVKKLLTLGLASVIALGTLSGCNSQQTSGDEVIKIGASFALTGDVAVYGKAARNGLELAIKEYNEAGGVLDKQIELIVEDNKGDEIEATNAFRKITGQNNVAAFVGSDISSTSEAIAKLANEENIPFITPTGTKYEITSVGKNVFRACYVDPYQGKVLADFAAQDLNGKTAAILTDVGNDYSIGISNAFKESFESQGGTIVTQESYTEQDRDYMPLLLNIKGSNPDILLIADYYGPVSLIAKQIKETGIDAILVGPDGWDGVDEQIVHDPSILEDSYFINHYSPEDTDPVVQGFIEGYKAEFNEVPNSFAALGYDAGKIVIEAIKNAGSTDPDEVTNQMQNSNIQGATGTITFDDERNPVKSVSIINIKDGKNTMFKKINP